MNVDYCVNGIYFEKMDDFLETLLNKSHYPPSLLAQHTYRHQALKDLPENELQAIYYLVESHARGLRAKAILRHEKILISPNGSQNTTLRKEYVAFSCNKSFFEMKITAMLSMVQEMPKEWLIVQLTPQFNPEQYLMNDTESHYTGAIHVTVFDCGKRQTVPFTYTVAAPRDAVDNSVVNLVQEMHSIVAENKSVLTATKNKHFGNLRERDAYYHKRQALDERLKRVIKDIEDMWLKELRCLLIGKYIDETLEANIQRQLKQFLDKEAPKFKVSDKVMNLLVCLTKGSHYLKMPELKRAVQFCFPQSEATNLHKSLVTHIRSLSEKLRLATEKKYPVILVVDDSLDCFPWEMMDVLSEESVSRVPSLHFAYALFKEHESEIVNGFKMIENHNNGTYIVNPDLDLKNMEDRIGNFLQYWLPTWEGVIGQKPTEVQFEKMLTSCNIFSYHGHGAGTQLFSMDKIQRIHVKAVVLLFGCGSTKLCEIGPQVEMYGAHQMYLIACSPCVVGMLWEVTDLDTDLLTTEFISQWLPSDVNIHWQFADKSKWKKNHGIIEFPKSRVPADGANGKSFYEAELLKALSMSRKNAYYYSTKAAVVARGIPVKIAL